MKSQIDYEKYVELLQAVASMSRLFSDNKVPYVDSRFVERLFIQATGAKDLSRLDKSFDALIAPDIGVGVKTFLSVSGNTKREKVAEFPRFAQDGEFLGLTPHQLALKVAGFRNKRVLSDANELAIDTDKSIYHCLVRTKTGAVIHEEPYRIVDISNIQPTDKHGKLIPKWSKQTRGVFFTDGKSNYNYNTSKNVLIKQFKFTAKPSIIELAIFDDIFDRVLAWFEVNKQSGFSVSSDEGKQLLVVEDPVQMKPGVDFVVLPLYSTRGAEKNVAPKSGINQWNAAGRIRKFGEAYIPIPSEVHRLCPKFFPDRDQKFDIILPNSSAPVQSKVCQEGRKALMSDPNSTLGHWIMKVLRPSLADSDFERLASSKDKPFTYKDLVSIGKDAVIVRKSKDKSKSLYSLEFAPLDSYEDFISEI